MWSRRTRARSNPNPKSLPHRGIKRVAHLRCRLTSLAEQHLHDLGVSEGRKVTQVFFIAGDLSQNSSHDLTCRTGEKLEFRSESRDAWRNWKCKNKIPVPERVLGSPGAFWMKSGVAIGPIFSLTEWKSQVRIDSDCIFRQSLMWPSDLFSWVPPSACGWTLCGLSEWRSSTDTLPSLHEADWPPLLQPPTGVHSEPPPPLLCSTNDLRDQTLLLKTHCSFKFRL